MNEKEFLIKFSDWLLKTKLEKKGRDENYYIDEFLEYHHKEYLPTYFCKLTATSETMRKATLAQAKLKMADFFEEQKSIKEKP